MKVPSDYNKVNIGNTERVKIGPHIAVIKGIENTQSKSGKDMIVVKIDFAKGDEQEGLFTRIFDADDRDLSVKKWPFQATIYILVNAPDGNVSRSFQAFNAAAEHSNNIMLADEDREYHPERAKGKKIGVMYGEVEEEYNGQVNTRTRIRWFFDVHKIDEQVTPLTKYLEKPAAAQGTDWMNVPETGKEELPFS